MAGEKNIKLHNKSSRPDNVVLREHEIVSRCEEIQAGMPRYLRGYFAYLKGNVLPRTRYEYLRDLQFFFRYLINETDLTSADAPSDIRLEEINSIKSVDINIFIDYCRKYSVEDDEIEFPLLYLNQIDCHIGTVV